MERMERIEILRLQKAQPQNPYQEKPACDLKTEAHNNEQTITLSPSITALKAGKINRAKTVIRFPDYELLKECDLPSETWHLILQHIIDDLEYNKEQMNEFIKFCKIEQWIKKNY